MIRSRKDKNENPRYQAIIKIKGYPNKAQTFRTKKEAKQWEIKIKAAMQEEYIGIIRMLAIVSLKKWLIDI